MLPALLPILSLASPPQCCPSCKLPLKPAKYRGHLAFCAPDLLDPVGWKDGDQEVVLRQVRTMHRKGSGAYKALMLRFGRDAITSQEELADIMGWSARKTRDTIASLLHSIPPVADSPGDHAPLQVLYEDDHMLAVDKPANVGVTPAHRWRGGSLLNLVVGHLRLGPRDASRVPRPCHRLDLETSGVCLFAKTSEAATSLMKQFERHDVKKSYVALCVAQPTATWTNASICKVAGATHCERRVCSPGEIGGQTARSKLTVLATSQVSNHAAGVNSDADTSPTSAPCLVLVEPEHGRTHQVRVHCSALGAPLVGDLLYGGGEAGIAAGMARQTKLTRHALHALAIDIKHPQTGRRLDIRSPLPLDMRRAAMELGVRSAVESRATAERPRSKP